MGSERWLWAEKWMKWMGRSVDCWAPLQGRRLLYSGCSPTARFCVIILSIVSPSFFSAGSTGNKGCCGQVSARAPLPLVYPFFSAPQARKWLEWQIYWLSFSNWITNKSQRCCKFQDWLCRPQISHIVGNVLGQVRTATKRAGGTVKNNGGSAGRRLGIKKFSGERLWF